MEGPGRTGPLPLQSQADLTSYSVLVHGTERACVPWTCYVFILVIVQVSPPGSAYSIAVQIQIQSVRVVITAVNYPNLRKGLARRFVLDWHHCEKVQERTQPPPPLLVLTACFFFTSSAPLNNCLLEKTYQPHSLRVTRQHTWLGYWGANELSICTK